MGEIALDGQRTVSVSVVNVQMPFMSMVVFMVKWALAAIPAFIILIVVGMIGGALLGACGVLMGGLASGR